MLGKSQRDQEGDSDESQRDPEGLRHPMEFGRQRRRVRLAGPFRRQSERSAIVPIDDGRDQYSEPPFPENFAIFVHHPAGNKTQ